MIHSKTECWNTSSSSVNPLYQKVYDLSMMEPKSLCRLLCESAKLRIKKVIQHSTLARMEEIGRCAMCVKAGCLSSISGGMTTGAWFGGGLWAIVERIFHVKEAKSEKIPKTGVSHLITHFTSLLVVSGFVKYNITFATSVLVYNFQLIRFKACLIE